jgi:phage recombination protein Bet
MSEAIAMKEPSALGTIAITPEQVDLVKTTVFQGATDDELKLYFFECRRRGVHPLDRLIHPVVRQDKSGTRRISFQTSIDLFRSEADNTGEYRGQRDVEYGEMIPWDKIDKKVPEYAKATIKRFDEHTGEIIEISATAYWEEYYPGEQLGFQWRKMPRLMLGKCAEALALRKAFPRKLAGLYTFEEMQLTDLVNQGKALKEPQRKQKPAEQKQEQKAENGDDDKSVKEKLHEELSLYCQFENGEVDMNMYQSVLKEISIFTGKNKEGQQKEYFIEDIFNERVSDKWAGTALGKLREKVGNKAQ